VNDCAAARLSAGAKGAVAHPASEKTDVATNPSLGDSENLPDPDVIAAEIAEDLRAALEQFEAIQADLGKR